MNMAAASLWPRDFRRDEEPTGGLVFIGSALQWINRAVDRTADDDDVRLGRSFIDRPDRDNPLQIEQFETQRWAFRRAETARAILLGWLRHGQVEAFWLPEDGQFQEVAQRTWGWRRRTAYLLGVRNRHNIHATTVDGALRRFGLADAYFVERKAVPPSGRRFIYVSASQLLRALVDLNPGAKHGFPNQPERTLDTFGPMAGEVWPLLATLTWIATRDEGATAGACAYPERWRVGNYAAVTASATHGFIEQQVADFFCTCRKPVCECWSSAKSELAQAAQSVSPRVVGSGFKANQGDVEQIPPAAWRGDLSFDEFSWLEPERPGGTRWASIIFRADDIRHAFPPKPFKTDAVSKPRAQPGSWKKWAKDAVSRGIGVGAAHEDAQTKLESDPPSREQARNLIREEQKRLGITAKQGPRPTQKG